jgi:hypothetical protein
METLIVHPDNKEKLTALKAVLKALHIKFEKSTSPYKAEFVEKILQGDADIKAGRTTKITLDDIWK